MRTEDEFWRWIAKTTDEDDLCWLYQGSKSPRGYGFVKWEGKTHRAHRIAYRLAVGPIPDGLFVCHRCDNPPCCRPSHLFLGTNSDNLLDAAAKGRIATGDRSGARLHPEKWTRGERFWSAKLTEDAVRTIRQLRQGGETLAGISRKFGVHYTTVRRACDRRTWKHVT